jgi:hypothetical protein
MANKKSNHLEYERKTGRTVVKIKGPSNTVMPFVWFDRLTVFLAFSGWAFGLIASHWHIFSPILQWLLHEIKSS